VNRALPSGDRGHPGQIRGGYPDVGGLCLPLADWSAELRLIRYASATETSAPLQAPE
jgi:hypothetical protein